MAAETNSVREGWIGRLFRISLYLKAADSLLELVSGLALYIASLDEIVRVTRALTRRELLEDPNNVIANYLLQSAESFSLDQKFATSLYLGSHGAIKLFLVVMVLREKMWAYPVFIAALALLIVFQSYQLTLHFSPGLAGLTVLDLVVLVLTWHEYHLRRAEKSG